MAPCSAHRVTYNVRPPSPLSSLSYLRFPLTLSLSLRALSSISGYHIAAYPPVVALTLRRGPGPSAYGLRTQPPLPPQSNLRLGHSRAPFSHPHSPSAARRFLTPPLAFGLSPGQPQPRRPRPVSLRPRPASLTPPASPHAACAACGCASRGACVPSAVDRASSACRAASATSHSRCATASAHSSETRERDASPSGWPVPPK